MTKEDAVKELKRLSKQIDDLIEDRQVFIETFMHLFAEFQIGQVVINKDTLQRMDAKEFWEKRQLNLV